MYEQHSFEWSVDHNILVGDVGVLSDTEYVFEHEHFILFERFDAGGPFPIRVSGIDSQGYARCTDSGDPVGDLLDELFGVRRTDDDVGYFFFDKVF